MLTGTIVRLVTDRGFGFIKPDNGGADLFFHAREMQNEEFDSLKEGLSVTFEEGTGPKGPIASKITVVEAAPAAEAPAEEAPAEESAEEAAPAAE